MIGPQNYTQGWVNQANRRRDNVLGDIVILALLGALVYVIRRNWRHKVCRFLTGAGIGCFAGLIAFGSLFASAWPILGLSALPAIVLGELLARFAGKSETAGHTGGAGA
jgi:hypothetical protein